MEIQAGRPAWAECPGPLTRAREIQSQGQQWRLLRRKFHALSTSEALITHYFPLERGLFPVMVEPISIGAEGGLGRCQRMNPPPGPL